MAINPTPDQALDPAAPPQSDEFDAWLKEDPRNEAFTRSLRNEAASNRIKAKHAAAQVVQQLAERIGHTYDPSQPPTLDDIVGRFGKLPEELKAARHELRAAKLDVSLERAFAAHGVKPKLTKSYLDSIGALSTLRSLDPSSETFDDDVSFHVASAVESEPALRGQSNAPRRTSAPMTPPPHSQQLNREDLDHMSADEIEGARKAGLLDEILGRRR